jgi:hypothetical protein
MRRDEHLLKTMSAVKVCIGECLKAPSPPDSLQKYLDSLRSDPQWNEAEIAEVEATAKKAIDAASRRSAPAPTSVWSANGQLATAGTRVTQI